MAICEDELRRHLDDYHKVTGKKTDRFVCPITLRPCDRSELINGHILNEAIIGADRRKIIQYGDIDHFYGGTVEPDLVRYLNLDAVSGKGILDGGTDLKVGFEDGTEAEAFFSGPEAGEKYPSVHLGPPSGPKFSLYLRIPMDDPRLTAKRASTKISHVFMPSRWAAGMLKAAYLAMFDMIGYQVLESAFLNDIRQRLQDFYKAKASPSEAPHYFKEFEHAMRFIAAADLQRYEALEADTLRDRMVLMHETMGGDLFASSVIFRIREMSVLVTLPGGITGTDAGFILRTYRRAMANDPELKIRVKRAWFNDDHLKIERTSSPFCTLDKPANVL